jgi:hypothetical protein
MSLGHGASIVRDGLVLHLDAASERSYSGSGTTWYDLSGNNRNGSINNSPTINANSFTFDGVDDNISFPNLVDLSHTDAITISFWCKLNSFTETNGGIHGILLEATNNFNSNTDGFYIGVGDDSTSTFNDEFPISLNLKGNTGYNIHGYDKTSVNDLEWHHWTCIFNKGVGALNGTNPVESEFYVDAVSKPVTTFVSTSLRTNNTNNFGETTFYIGGRTGTSYNLDFDLGAFSIYDKVLSQTEITKNFNALRGRYGI